MGIPISELQDRITSDEFTQYVASYMLEPPVGRLLDEHVALIAYVTAASAGAKEIKPDTFYVDRFDMRTPEEREEQEMFKSISAFANVHNARNQNKCP